MKRLLLIFVSLICVPFISEEARACTCIDYDVPVCAAYWQSDAVFAGQLVDITPVERTSDRQPSTVLLHFIVEQPFRGVSDARVEVETPSGTSCDMPFGKGERYLIYASRDQESKRLFTGLCSRSENLKFADKDLNYLRAVTHQEVNESILGRVVRNQYQPVPGLKVTVTSGDKTLETMTNDKGDFSFQLPGPGSYTVKAFIPFAAAVATYRPDEQGDLQSTDTLTTFAYDVELAKSQCNYRQIEAFKIDLHATAEVSGNVLNASGKPVSSGLVYLINAQDPNRSDFKRLDENGSFKFEYVPVGEYYLALNPHNEAPREDDAPYPRTYYPNAAEPSAATKIVVTEGAKLENLTLRVGQIWKARVVMGRVVWPDGRRVQNGNVSLYDGDRYVQLIKLDDKGRFNFKVYGDFKYAIVAEAWGPVQGRSERLPITKEKSTGLKLVLKPID